MPEHLRKPELIFEVSSRGQEPAADVKGLRAQLRKVLNLDRSWQTSFDLDNEIAVCETRVEELGEEIEGMFPLPTGSAKASLGTQLLHWQARLSILCQAPEISDESAAWAAAKSKVLRQALDTLVGTLSVKERQAAFEPSSVATTPTAMPEPAAALIGPAAGGEVDLAAPLKCPASLPGLPLGFGAGVQSTGGGAFSAFSKLPHPLSATLSSLRQIDGLEINSLLGFLEEVFRIREFPGMTDAMLLELIAPFCLKPLRDRLFDCLRRQTSFDKFHSEVLDYFVPTRVMERLKVERVYRAQAHHETLSQFVSDIRAVGQVLRLGFSESQLVETILQGIKPEERSRLVFAPRPSSFADLDKLCIFSRSVQDADFQRGEPMGHRTQPPPRPVNVSMSRPSSYQHQQREAPVCFGCGQRGHVRRDCRQMHRGPSGSKN